MNRVNRKLKFKLIVQSFLPLSIFVAIKNAKLEMWKSLLNFLRRLFAGEISILLDVYEHPHTWAFLIFLISVLIAISGFMAMWQFKEVHVSGFIDAGETVRIEEEVVDSGITFFMTFILPLMMDDIECLNDFLVYNGVILMVILLMSKTNLYYQNPVLTLLGYRLFRIKFENPSLEECKNMQFIAVCKEELEEKKVVKWKYISDNICLMYNKH